MNRQQFEAILTVGAIFLFLLGAAVAWGVFVWVGAERAFLLLPIGVALALVAAFWLNRFIQAYFFEARRIPEEITLMMTANPAHRLQIEAPAPMQQVAQAINAFGERYQTMLADQQARIQEARANLEDERNRLAALVSDLSEGIVVCTLEGQILLVNSYARQLLSQAEGGNGSAGGAFVGLGRSIFGLIDRHSITHALESLHVRLEQPNADLVAHFVVTASNGRLVRTRLTPVLDQARTVSGFILTLEDITQQLETSNRRDLLLRTLTEGMRAPLANIRAAIETMEQFPAMETTRLARFRAVIQDESARLSAHLDQTMAEYDTYLKAQWQLEEMLGADLLLALQRRLGDRQRLRIDIQVEEDDLWIKVDSYAIMQAMTFLARRLQEEAQLDRLQFQLKRIGRFVALDAIWHGTPVDSDTLRAWQNEALIVNREGAPWTMTEVAERHGGEVWSKVDPLDNVSYFRLLIQPVHPRARWRAPINQESRPEYYDFDLFRQATPSPALEERPLSELTYTIFDTETTGLDITAGDEIISLSAVRIVNGRLLRHEYFDQLVDPRRPVPGEATAIHGISTAMVKGQPTIAQVLPLFQRFAEETVLVGHNVAFDMRLLQLKEAETGIRFDNPVLDTLLLSPVAHPNQETHSLEAIAQRLGINIIGRHTSLGDAMVTAEIFIKLIPLLEARGIHTLGEARRAAQQTYYARISY